jgi:CNT family concentrative nucleoside transporter
LARFTGLIGLVVLLGVAYALLHQSPGHPVAHRCLGSRPPGLLRHPRHQVELRPDSSFKKGASNAVTNLLGHAVDGSSMVFGPLGDSWHIPLERLCLRRASDHHLRLRTSSLVLYHLGFMQQVIRVVAWVMQRTMGTSGAESTNVAASIFMGQTEAPAHHSPLPRRRHALGTHDHHDLRHGARLRRHHGGVHQLRHQRAQDLLSAVIMTAPGTILVAKMLVPETEVPATAWHRDHAPPSEEHKSDNLIAAIARGTIDGGQLAFNVAIMLISFLALVGLLQRR